MTSFYDPKTGKHHHRSWKNKKDIDKMIKEAKKKGWVYRDSNFLRDDDLDMPLTPP